MILSLFNNNKDLYLKYFDCIIKDINKLMR